MFRPQQSDKPCTYPMARSMKGPKDRNTVVTHQSFLSSITACRLMLKSSSFKSDDNFSQRFIADPNVQTALWNENSKELHPQRIVYICKTAFPVLQLLLTHYLFQQKIGFRAFFSTSKVPRGSFCSSTNMNIQIFSDCLYLALKILKLKLFVWWKRHFTKCIAGLNYHFSPLATSIASLSFPKVFYYCFKNSSKVHQFFQCLTFPIIQAPCITPSLTVPMDPSHKLD